MRKKEQKREGGRDGERFNQMCTSLLKEIVSALCYNPYLKPSQYFCLTLRQLLICDYALHHTKTEIFISVKNNHPVITMTNCPGSIIVAISTNDIVL